MSESHLDSLNRYLPAVAITTAFRLPERGTDIRTCSGVLIHPQVVLTAGHSPPVVLSSYTSVPKYLKWIRQKVAEAEARGTD